MGTVSARAQAGFRLIDPGETINRLAAGQGYDARGGITALAGGGRSASTPVLRTGFNRVSVCATNADSVVLPPAIGGSFVVVANKGAADLTVFGNGSDTIDGTAGATGVTQADPLTAIYFCITDTIWNRLLSA